MKDNMKKFIRQAKDIIKNENKLIDAERRKIGEYKAILDIAAYSNDYRIKKNDYREKINICYEKIDTAIDRININKNIINKIVLADRIIREGEKVG